MIKIRNTQKRQAKRAVKELLNKFKSFDIDKDLLLSLTQPAYVKELEIFAGIAETAKNLKINDYKFLTIKTYAQNAIFGHIIEIDYNIRKDDEISESFKKIIELRVVPETQPGVVSIDGKYMPNLQFIKFLHNDKIKKERNELRKD